MGNQIKEQGYVIKHKESDDFYGINMLDDWTLGEPIGSATIFNNAQDAKDRMNVLAIDENQYEIRRIERRVIWRII